MGKKPINREAEPKLSEVFPEGSPESPEKAPEGIVAERVAVIEDASKKRAKLMRDIFKAHPKAADYLKRHQADSTSYENVA